MDLQTLRGQVLALLAEDGTGFIDTTDVDDYLREGQLDVATKTDCVRDSAKASGIEVGTARYLLPADMIRATLVTWGGARIAETTLEAAVANPTSGTPTKYAIWGRDIILSPVPDAVAELELHYIAMPVPMLVDADPSGLPADVEPLLKLYARAKGLEQDRHQALADALWQQYFTGAGLAKKRHNGIRPPVQWSVARR